MRHKRRFNKSDRKINRKNKKLMADKILSYNPMLLEGIEVYKDANRNFIFLIFLGTLLINFPLISVPCCILSMFFIVKMLQFVRYKTIDDIVKKLAKDLSYKGIYDKEKVEYMLDDFNDKYGEDVIEYRELVDMVNKYEALVIKIEYVLRNINMKEKKSFNDTQNVLSSRELLFCESENNLDCGDIQGKQYKKIKVSNCLKGFNEKSSVFYEKEDGEIKEVNKAIEFFETENNEFYDKENAVVLKNVNKENKNLTVYLYKKSPDLQNNAL